MDHIGYYLSLLLGQNLLTYLSKQFVKKRVVSPNYRSTQATNHCFSNFTRLKSHCLDSPFCQQYSSFDSEGEGNYHSSSPDSLQTSRCWDLLDMLFSTSTFSMRWKRIEPSPRRADFFSFVLFWTKPSCCMLEEDWKIPNFYSKLHPIILHRSHPITKLIIQSEHLCLLHTGPTLLISLNQRLHIIGFRKTVRSITRQCKRQSLKPHDQLLGQLPLERVTPASVFEKVGVHYAGPFQINM